MRGALGLLGGGELHIVAEHVDTGQLEGAVAAHRLTQRRGLGFERRLRHHMTGQPQIMRFAPLADRVGEGGSEPLGHVIVVAVTGKRPGAAGELPDQFGQRGQKLGAVRSPIGIRKVVGIGEDHILPLPGKLQHRFEEELRLVGEDRRNRPPEFIPHAFGIRLMRHLDETADRGRIEGVDVGFVIEPAPILPDHSVEIELFESLRRLLRLFDHPVFGQTAVGIEPDRIAAEQQTGIVIGRIRRFRTPFRGEKQVAGAELRLPCDDAARRAGGPAVLIVEPGEHRIASGDIDALADHLHELRFKIGGGQPRPGMHVKSSHAHFVECGDLAADLLPIQFAVPRPEWSVSVERPRGAEQLFETLLLIGSVQVLHIRFPSEQMIFRFHASEHSGKRCLYYISPSFVNLDFLKQNQHDLPRMAPEKKFPEVQASSAANRRSSAAPAGSSVNSQTSASASRVTPGSGAVSSWRTSA